MKKILALMLLTLGALALAAPSALAQAQPTQKKEIKDQAEYNAYVAAIQQTDVSAKISGLEAFAQQYPNSVVREDGMEALLAAYQQTNNAAKVEDVAQRLLVVNPNNIKALAILSYLKKAGGDFVNARTFAERGSAALAAYAKPPDVKQEDYDKQKVSFTELFNNVIGYSAWQTKDFATAQQHLKLSVAGNPTSLEDVYALAVSSLPPSTPEDMPNGLFWIARAAALSTDPKGKDQITKFGHSKYVKYHGADDGWAQLLAQAANAPAPPPDLAATITKYVPPTPEQQAADIVQKKQPKDMDFAEWELVLSEGKQEDKDKVWNAIKGQPLQMVGNVISATPTKVQLAASVDDIEAKRVDIELTMTGPIPAKLMPKEGTDLQFGGVPDGYIPKPFVMQLITGSLLTAAPAPKKAPVHKKAAAH
jgi:tetratricopeptide (TPR) repeat protein